MTFTFNDPQMDEKFYFHKPVNHKCFAFDIKLLKATHVIFMFQLSLTLSPKMRQEWGNTNQSTSKSAHGEGTGIYRQRDFGYSYKGNSEKNCNLIEKTIGEIWRRKWQPTPVLLPRESRGQRSLVGCCS